MVSPSGFWSLAQKLRLMGLVTPWHMELFQSRNQRHVSYTDQWVLYHFATREALILFLNIDFIEIVVKVFCMLLYAYSTFFFFELV